MEGEERAGRTQKGRLQQHTTLLTQMEPPAAMATGAEQASQRAKGFKNLAAIHSVQSGPGAGSQSFADKNLLPLTPRQLAAFQDVFRLFSSGPAGTVDTRSMKIALRNVGIHLSPQEMCEAVQQADLDGDGTVSFKDFLAVLTDSHRLAQCLRQVRNSQVRDPQNLQTLFLEMVFKLMRQGFVPYKSTREVMSYYSKKQQALRLTAGCKSPGRSRSQGHSPHAQAGLTFFCQAMRLSGLTDAELARSLQRLHRAGAHSPYSQIPNLAEGTWPEHRTWNRASCPEVRLPKPYASKSYPSSHSKLGPNQGQRSQGFGDQPVVYVHPWKLAPSPPTLVQKQPFPSPACLQRPAMKNLYK
ncbi:EF-hand calcium-binding domain-containing protein 3 [Rhinolophus ferrumequinum]|uniref:EF-hand calcium-binding domain-containing protein 3 n=1 Tax=Rhinolophus ferrumequinum TaxID=59479 RepID=UPI00140F643B|nr:EF-hand calcium-binding domain-containing protein 3 [Rhinolophus ferrumequinum]